MTVSIPPIGLGTSGMDDPDECAGNVRVALESGYRHIDTAQMYANEEGVGDGLAASVVPREEVFLATKVLPANLGYEDVIASTEASLDRLGVEQVDLLYIHWPIEAYEPADTLPAFDEIRERGWTDHVGVSNFDTRLLDQAREILDAPIVANQIEMHPLLPPDPELLTYCFEHDIAPVAYSPLCRGEALDVTTVEAVADRHGVSAARAIIAWLLTYDVRVITKASGKEHIVDNLAAIDLALSAEDSVEIAGVERRHRRFDREEAPWNR
jgi:2,5-diketo-D-gluconate reductase B